MANQTNETLPKTGTPHDEPLDLRTASGNIADSVEKNKEMARTLVDQAKTAAGKAYETATDRASQTIDEKKAGLTSGLTSVADSIRQAGESLKGDQENTVTEYSAKYAQTAAEKIEGIAHYFEGADLRSMARDLEGYARRNPAIFLGGAFALGVLAARFFKSSPTKAVGAGVTVQDPSHQLAPRRERKANGVAA